MCSLVSAQESSPPVSHDSLEFDSTFEAFESKPDSLSVSESTFASRWLYPAGVILVSGAAFIGLFFIRSR
jgi:hypothetical protein